MRRLLTCCMICTTLVGTSVPAVAQMPPSGPPTVDVVAAQIKPVTETSEFNGRIEAVARVNLIARVSAFLEEQLFQEGSDVKRGQPLFRLEKPPFEAEVDAKQASLAQAQATQDNARIGFNRADQLRKTGSGSQSTLDDSVASARTAAAQVQAAQAALRTAQINLGYTEITSPIDGRIGRSSASVGNFVSPSSGTLATIVSQDPIYVTFPVPTAKLVELRDKYASASGASAALKLRVRLPNGRLYEHEGKLDFYDISVAQDTDSVILRGTIPNPAKQGGLRELINDQFVRVILEEVKPQNALSIPRSAIMTGQEGSYVYVVNGENIVEQRMVKLGQSSPTDAVILEGLKAEEKVIVNGVQRARPNAPVVPETISQSTTKSE